MVAARNFFEPVRTERPESARKARFPGHSGSRWRARQRKYRRRRRGLRHLRQQRQGNGAGARAEIEDAADPFPCGSLAQEGKHARRPAFPCRAEAPASRAKGTASARRSRESPRMRWTGSPADAAGDGGCDGSYRLRSEQASRGERSHRSRFVPEKCSTIRRASRFASSMPPAAALASRQRSFASAAVGQTQMS